jgi:hypothetical protein
MLSPARSAAVGSPPSIKKARIEARREHKRQVEVSPVPAPDFDLRVEDPFSNQQCEDLLKKLKF